MSMNQQTCPQAITHCTKSDTNTYHNTHNITDNLHIKNALISKVFKVNLYQFNDTHCDLNPTLNEVRNCDFEFYVV